MKSVFVEQINERDQVDSLFLVRDKILAMAKNGKPYMTLKLMDRSGEVEGRIWDQVEQLDGLFKKNDFVRIRAKASVYLGKMQLIISSLQPIAESEVELGDFLPVSACSVSEMLGEVHRLIDEMHDADYQRLLRAFFEDSAFVERYAKAPAAKSMHHVYLGGLLEHSLSVARLAVDVSRRYPRLDPDLLVTGALLHDIGKVTELDYARSFDYSDEGKLIGHIVIGVEMVADILRPWSDFPPQKAMLIKHLLLSHHGQYDYGSPKRPKTLEAVVLNFIDDLDSKINGVQAHLDHERQAEGNWTSYHRLYDRYFFAASTPEPPTGPMGCHPAPQPEDSRITPVGKPVRAGGESRTQPVHKNEKSRSQARSQAPLRASLGEQMAELNFSLFSAGEEQPK
ncbi:MAG: HD domain-containing protein [Desulfuromonadaceae bacterium]|nr:HD domain-containing protein [Desulfuromonadaceae bacterium]